MREIRSTKRQVRLDLGAVVHLEAGEDELRAWLLEQSFAAPLWLLAHTLTGVVWGKVHTDPNTGQKTLVTSYDLFAEQVPADLRPAHVQMCRLFGQDGELLLWPDGDALRSRLYVDGAVDGEDVSYFDEEQILWGTQVEAGEEGFMLVSDGVQGLKHAVPYLQPEAFDPSDAAVKQRPLRLAVRHYLATDSGDTGDGTVHIAGSRLVELKTQRVPLG